MAASRLTADEGRAQFDAANAIAEMTSEESSAAAAAAAAQESYYYYDADAAEAQKRAKAWKADPHYFKHVKISAVAVLKMVLHAYSTAKGATKLEVMGIMLGKVDGDTIFVMDCFALPIVGEEAFVAAQEQANVYMSNYAVLSKTERGEVPIGWYHSHPGLKVFLSGTDCQTQRTYQRYFDPWLAVVVDPVRTMTTGKVELGSYRTWPDGYTPPGARAGDAGWEAVPEDKMAEFGAHANAYYKLETTFFKSRADDALLSLLWEQYWIAALSENPLLSNREYFSKSMAQTATTLGEADEEIGHSGRFKAGRAKAKASKLSMVAANGAATTVEQLQALMTQVVKDALFNRLDG